MSCHELISINQLDTLKSDSYIIAKNSNNLIGAHGIF